MNFSFYFSFRFLSFLKYEYNMRAVIWIVLYSKQFWWICSWRDVHSTYTFQSKIELIFLLSAKLPQPSAFPPSCCCVVRLPKMITKFVLFFSLFFFVFVFCILISRMLYGWTGKTKIKRRKELKKWKKKNDYPKLMQK